MLQTRFKVLFMRPCLHAGLKKDNSCSAVIGLGVVTISKAGRRHMCMSVSVSMLLQEGCITHAWPMQAQQVCFRFFRAELTCKLNCLLAGQAGQQGLRD